MPGAALTLTSNLLAVGTHWAPRVGSTAAENPPAKVVTLPGLGAGAGGKLTFLASRPRSAEFMLSSRKISASARNSLSAPLAALPIWPPAGSQPARTPLQVGHSGLLSQESKLCPHLKFWHCHVRITDMHIPVSCDDNTASRKSIARFCKYHSGIPLRTWHGNRA